MVDVKVDIKTSTGNTLWSLLRAVLVLGSFFGHPKRYVRGLEDVSLHGHTFVEFDEVAVPRLTSGKCELDGQVFGIIYILRVTLN